MQTQTDIIYRKLITLRDGTRVLLRPLAKEDRQALIDLFSTVDPEELALMRHNVRDPEVVGKWVDELDYDRVFPLVAVLGARIIGNTTLHKGQGQSRHIGEVRIYLTKEFRNRSLGTRMLQNLIEIAVRRGLLMLEIRVINDRTEQIRAFQNAGFVSKYIMEDGCMLSNGELRAINHLVLRLRSMDEGF